MTGTAHYKVEHWMSATADADYRDRAPVEITVNDRAATREAIITEMRKKGYAIVERSRWGAIAPRAPLEASHWDYSDIVLHHAGRSYTCAINTASAVEQMKKAQEYDMGKFDDIGYHYAVSCPGEIFEARDVRHTGSHVKGNNTGKLGIVLLENLAEAGEGWQQEYRQKSWWEQVKGSLDIARDAVALDHEKPTTAQLKALTALISTLQEFFNIKALGGHREYQMLAPGHEGRACPGKFGMQVVTEMRSRFSLDPPS